MVIAVVIANLVVNGWLLAVMHRQHVRRQLPWFVLYIAWGFFSACVGMVSWLVSPSFYVAVFWWMEGLQVMLIVGAVRESFLRIFWGFTAMRWFRWSVWAVITGVVLYSAWKAIYHPPVQGGRIV